jgi:hypothetical protein
MAAFPPSPEACVAAVGSACLMPWLLQELRVTSFNDMCARQPYYASLMRLVLQLCRPQFAHLLCTGHRPGSSSGGGGAGEGGEGGSSSTPHSSLAAAMAPLAGASQQFIKVCGHAVVMRRVFGM